MTDENTDTPAQERKRAPRARAEGERPTGDKVERDPKKAALYQTLARAIFQAESNRPEEEFEVQELRGQRKEEWEAVKSEKMRVARRMVRLLEKRGRVNIEFVGEPRQKGTGRRAKSEE